MNVNALPEYDMTDNPTGCCPRFKPEGWEGQTLHFADKPFVRATTWSLFHIPVNIGSVFTDTFKDIEEAGAMPDKDFIVLSRDPSSWQGEHLFAVSKDVPDHEMVRLSGDFITKVFEGPFKNAPDWEKELAAEVRNGGKEVETIYFFYTTCPKCAKAYGKNYVVGVAKIKS